MWFPLVYHFFLFFSKYHVYCFTCKNVNLLSAANASKLLVTPYSALATILWFFFVIFGIFEILIRKCIKIYISLNFFQQINNLLKPNVFNILSILFLYNDNHNYFYSFINCVWTILIIIIPYLIIAYIILDNQFI